MLCVDKGVKKFRCKKGIVFFVLFLVSWLDHANLFSTSEAGTRGPGILKRETGVRAAGLAGAFVSVVDDASAVDWNPAGLQNLTHSELMFMHEDGFADQFHEFAAFAHPFWGAGKRRTWAGRISYVSVDAFDTVIDGQETGRTRPWEAVAGLSYAETLGSVSVGVTGKMVHQTGTGQSGQAYAIDGGLLGKRGRMSWGSSLANVGTSLKLGSEKIGLPVVWRNGVSYQHPFAKNRNVLLMALEFDVPVDGKPFSAFGLEYRTPLSPDWRAALRGGYRTRETGTGDGTFVAGAGLERGPFRFNYAFEPNQQLGPTNRFDVGIRFGGPLPEEVRINELLAQTQTDLELGRWADGKEKLEEIARLAPDHPKAQGLSQSILIRFAESLDPEMLLEEGDLAFAAGQFEKSAEFYRKLVLIQPELTSVNAKLDRAEAAIRKERMDRAKAAVETGRRRELQNQVGWAQEAERHSDWESALARWRKVLALDGKNSLALAGVERARFTLYTEAKTAEASGEDEKARFLFSASQVGMASYKDSAARMTGLSQKIDRKRAEEGRRKYSEGTRAFAAGDWKRAHDLFEEAHKAVPKDPAILRALDRVREELSRQGPSQ